MEKKVALAIELERATRAADPRVRQVSSADYSDSRVEVALASTTGIRLDRRRTTAFLSVDAIAGEGADTQTGTGFSVGRSPRSGARRGDGRRRAAGHPHARSAEGASAHCTVVFDPRVVSTLCRWCHPSALSGEAVVKGRSFFAGRIGESVADGVTLVDDPTDARAFTASSHDGEGLACRRNVLDFGRDAAHVRVRHRVGAPGPDQLDRIGCAWRLRRPTVRRLPGTGPVTRHAGGRGDPLRGRHRSVRAVGDRHPLGVNPVSGDFSVGAEGLMIRGGTLAEPVREVTVASTLQRMLQAVVAIGSDLTWLPGVAAGQTLAIADMQLSGG
jgi:PmbA protein